jgi:hypothetical protein
MKYVICTLLFWGVLCSDLSGNTTTDVGKITDTTNQALGVAQNLAAQQSLRAQQLLAYKQFAEELRGMGIEPEKCKSWSRDQGQALRYLRPTGRDGKEPNLFTAGTCVNPAPEDGSYWKEFLKENSKCSNYTKGDKGECEKESNANPEPFADWSSFKAKAGSVSVCKKESDSCFMKFKEAAELAKAEIRNNCSQCKALESLKSTLDQTLATIASLGGLATSIYGLSQKEQQAALISCEQKCASVKSKPKAYEDCMCTSSYTLKDGTSMPCRQQSECTPSKEDNCAEQNKMMVEQGLCSGSFCDYLDCKCKCSAHSMECDEKTLECVPAGTGTDKPDSALADYKGGDFKGAPSAEGLGTEEGSEASSASGGSLAGVGGGMGSTSGVDPKQEDYTEKAGFAASRQGTGATGFAGRGSEGSYGEYGATSEEEASGEYAQEAGAEGIAEAGEKSIWQLIEEVYAEGITANKFLSAEYKDAKEKAPEKKNIKKGGKKSAAKKKA